MRVAVIGAGPSGLVTLKYLAAAHATLDADPVEARLFEAEAGVGGTFLSRTYEDVQLVSSRQLTTFSDFRLPDEADFLTAVRYVKYLEDYCTEFALWPFIRLSCTVLSVLKLQTGSGYEVMFRNALGNVDNWVCDAIAVCSGLHVYPNIPQIEGIERVPVRLHSSEFKSRSQFGTDKTVLLLGAGETAADIGYLAVTAPTSRVVLCHRNGFHLAPTTNPMPRIIGTRARQASDRPPVPIDISRASLFDTAYVHPLLRKSMLLWNFYDAYVRSILWLSWGTTHGMDQWVAGKPKGWTTAEIFFNKSSKIGPYINNRWRPDKPQGTLAYLRSLLVHTPKIDTGGRHIDVAPWPKSIDEQGRVIFRENERAEYLRIEDDVIKPDVIVFCTGYRRYFPFLPYINIDANVRQIWNRHEPNIGFIGFVRPNLGAIPPLAEMQAQLWVLHLLAPDRVQHLRPEDEAHYELIHSDDARVRHGVDQESYTYQLALDMHSAPSFTELLRLGWCDGSGQPWNLPLTWALSANITTKFRLRGPWKWPGAADVMRDEIWDTVARRPVFFGHITLSVLPIMIFGPISLVLWLYQSILDLFGRAGHFVLSLPRSIISGQVAMFAWLGRSLKSLCRSLLDTITCTSDKS